MFGIVQTFFGFLARFKLKDEVSLIQEGFIRITEHDSPLRAIHHVLLFARKARS
jgi:hypothetical protein